jgi:prepilin-type N-terminal cleavage/methylation domain-containing protein/prepilin-type processing-associated H-X9-DG protein
MNSNCQVCSVGSATVPRAFTLIELLVVIAIVAVLAGLLLPTLGKAKAKAQGIECMGHLRELTLAWKFYADDNNERIPYAAAASSCWTAGHLTFSSDPENWDPEVSIKKGALWPYCDNARVWRCPADRSRVVLSSGPRRGQRVSRVRSMMMSIWMGGVGPEFGFGGDDGTFDFGPGVNSRAWRMYRRLNSLVDPGPSRTILLWDAREDDMFGSSFWVDMSGYPDRPLQYQLDDFPGSYHNRAGGVAFADGHAEIKRWVDARTAPPLKKNSTWLLDLGKVPSPNNPDVAWLQERATRELN